MKRKNISTKNIMKNDIKYSIKTSSKMNGEEYNGKNTLFHLKRNQGFYKINPVSKQKEVQNKAVKLTG